ncbi:MAG: Lrp/AsnC family transcriptional regulator [Acidobacteriota bacterium]
MWEDSNLFRSGRRRRPLDRIDCEILRALQKHARLSNKELAARLGVAQSTCHERVKRLVEDGVLRGFHAEVDPRALGIGIEAMIAVRLRRHSRPVVESFRAYAIGLPQVLAVYHMTGGNDFLVHVAVRDSDALRELGMSAFTTRDEVDHMETALIFEHVACRELPVYAEVGD